MTFQALRMYNFLLKHTDGMTERHADGTAWAQVYTADMQVPGITTAQHGGYLSALETAGVYVTIDRNFGLVLVPSSTPSPRRSRA